MNEYKLYHPSGLPDNVKIGAIDVKIRCVSEITFPDGSPDIGSGVYDSGFGEIQVIFDRPGMVPIVTLIHEILHGIWYSYSLENGDNQERVVQAFSCGLSAAMRDNQELFQWILNRLGS